MWVTPPTVAWRTIAELSLPNKYLSDSADDAQRPAAKMFAEFEPGFAGTDSSSGRRRGSKTAIATVRQRRRRNAIRR